jgi:hypothetical protein
LLIYPQFFSGLKNRSAHPIIQFMKRVVAVGLLFACISLAGCVAAVVGGGGNSGPGQRCQERDPRNCETK